MGCYELVYREAGNMQLYCTPALQLGLGQKHVYSVITNTRKVILVTGANKGIGPAIVSRLLSELSKSPQLQVQCLSLTVVRRYWNFS